MIRLVTLGHGQVSVAHFTSANGTVGVILRELDVPQEIGSKTPQLGHLQDGDVVIEFENKESLDVLAAALTSARRNIRDSRDAR